MKKLKAEDLRELQEDILIESAHEWSDNFGTSPALGSQRMNTGHLIRQNPGHLQVN
jgi:hypothetical protein